MLTGIEKGFSFFILARFELKIVVRLRLNNTQIIESIIFIKFHRSRSSFLSLSASLRIDAG